MGQSALRWDWDPATQGLARVGGVYRNEFRTLPDPTVPLAAPFTFAVIGDFGTGIRKPSTATKRQREVGLALQRAVDTEHVRLILTTGDNIYAAQRFLLWTKDSGDEDDDWFFTFFQPYRYAINRVPVCPSIGNHDTRETEECDDRGQVMDNFYLAARLAPRGGGRPGVGRPRTVLSLPRRVGRRVRLHRHLEGTLLQARTAVRAIPSTGSSCRTRFRLLPAERIRWRIPFCHHPPFCAGPQHHNTDGMDEADRAVRGGRRPRLLQRARAQLPALASPRASTISSPARAARSGSGTPVGWTRRTP